MTKQQPEPIRKRLENQLHIARLKLALANGERSRAHQWEEIERLKQAIAHLDFDAHKS